MLIDSLSASGLGMSFPTDPFIVTGPHDKFSCGVYIARYRLRNSCAITPMFLDLKKKEQKMVNIVCLLRRGKGG